MNKTQHRKEMNKLRYEVLNGHGTLIVIDHFNKTITEYKQTFHEDNVNTHDDVENKYIPNGWRHLKNIEESLE